MITKLRIFIAIIGITLGIAALSPAAASAQSVISGQCKGVTDSQVCNDRNDNSNDFVGKIVNTLIFVVGGLSVIMIIVGGLLYVLSAGDSGNVTRAKNTVLYAVVALIVALLAYAIVNWVFRQFK